MRKTMSLIMLMTGFAGPFLVSYDDTQQRDQQQVSSQQIHFDQQRINEKKERFYNKAEFSRWAWRSAEFLGAIGIYLAYQSWNNTAYARQQQSIEDLKQEMRRRLDQLERNNNVNNTQAQTQQSPSMFSLEWLKLKGNTIGQYALNTSSQLFHMGVMTAAAQVPMAFYRKIVSPIYLTNISHFLQNYTQLNTICDTLQLFSKDNVHERMVLQYRHNVLPTLRDDIESICAFLYAARDYLTGSEAKIDREIDAFYKLISDHVDALSHDQATKADIGAAAQEVKNLLESLTKFHDQIVDNQDIIEYLTAL